MKDDEVADPMYSSICNRLYSAASLGSNVRSGKWRELRDSALNEMDAGGFEWFEAARQQRNAVLVPEFLAPAGREARNRGSALALPSRFASNIAAASSSLMKRRNIRSDPVPQRNAPLPSGLAGRGP
jgi:hypothetical protein